MDRHAEETPAAFKPERSGREGRVQVGRGKVPVLPQIHTAEIPRRAPGGELRQASIQVPILRRVQVEL